MAGVSILIYRWQQMRHHHGVMKHHTGCTGHTIRTGPKFAYIGLSVIWQIVSVRQANV